MFENNSPFIWGVSISKFLRCGRVAAWQRGHMAANKTLPYFDRGRVAAWPQPLI